MACRRAVPAGRGVRTGKWCRCMRSGPWPGAPSARLRGKMAFRSARASISFCYTAFTSINIATIQSGQILVPVRGAPEPNERSWCGRPKCCISFPGIHPSGRRFFLSHKCLHYRTITLSDQLPFGRNSASSLIAFASSSFPNVSSISALSSNEARYRGFNASD